MAKVDYLRIISGRFPEIVERIISLWGSPELGRYINGILRDVSAPPRNRMSGDVIRALGLIKEEHDHEFPQHVVDLASEISDKVIQNEDFKRINEKFPHIGRRLAVTWGRSEFSIYINDLINNSRDGKRQGFPKEIVLALFKLMQAHDAEFPEHELKIADIWELNNER